MELVFLALTFNHSILRRVGLDSVGPLDQITVQKATLASAAVLAVGFIGGFFLYSRMGSRVGGVIAIPLAAVEALSSPLLVPYLILGIGISYCIGELFFRKLLIYGRRLFYVYLAASVVVMAQLLVGYNLEPLSFSFIIPGIIAYNMHVDRDKKQSIVIAILYFAALILVGMAAIIVQRGL